MTYKPPQNTLHKLCTNLFAKGYDDADIYFLE